MSGKRAPASKKRKKAGGSSASWLLYPLAVIVGTTAGVLYHFSTAPAASTAATASRPAKQVASAKPAPKLERASRRRRARPPVDEPTVQVRSLEAPAKNTPATNAPEPVTAPAEVTVTASTPLPPTEIERGAGTRPEVALTFDAGSDWKPVKAILQALERRNLKATFFLTGEWVEKNPKTTQLIASAGHEIGNHSWDHPAFTRLKDEQIRDQLRRTETIIQAATGKSSRPYFPAPSGDRDARVRQLVGEEGYLTVYWTLDSRDSVDRGITSEQIRQRVLDKAAPGSIVLLHCGSSATAEALPALLDGLAQRKLEQVPLSRLLRE